MSWNNPVIWSEGMLLQPQHLQQHSRFMHSMLEWRVAALRPYSWGFSALQIDERQLALGKLALLACAAVLPDGTAFSLPSDDDVPLPFEVPENTRDALVVLALPVRRAAVAETSDEAYGEGFARYRRLECEVKDSNGDDSRVPIQVGKLRLRLALQEEVADAYAYLGVARIVERRADGRVLLDPDYCPPCLDCQAAPRLSHVADELMGLLRQRGKALAERLAQPGVGGAAEITDFLWLQLINRYEPLFAHFASMSGLHPEALFATMVQLAGEMATFSRADKRTVRYPVYRHEHLQETFTPVIDDLRKSLSLVMQSQAIAIPLEERQFGIRVAVVPDAQLLKSATFVLAVSAHVPAETLRASLPKKIKISTVEKINDLVNLQLPGLEINALSVVPRQLPFHAGFTYFELDRKSELWQQLLESAGFGLHVAGDFPGLQMEFWAIRPDQAE